LTFLGSICFEFPNHNSPEWKSSWFFSRLQRKGVIRHKTSKCWFWFPKQLSLHNYLQFDINVLLKSFGEKSLRVQLIIQTTSLFQHIKKTRENTEYKFLISIPEQVKITRRVLANLAQSSKKVLMLLMRKLIKFGSTSL
jgi:hypothetical protein